MQRHEVLVVDRLFVNVVPVVVIEVHGGDPLLVRRDDHPPDAPKAVQVDDEEEDQLVELQKSFEFFRRAQVRDDLAQAEHSHKLERTEYLKRSILAAEEPFTDRVEG